MPLIRRIPKRGFNNARHTTRYIPVNLESLNQFSDGARVDFESCARRGWRMARPRRENPRDRRIDAQTDGHRARIQRVGAGED